MKHPVAVLALAVAAAALAEPARAVPAFARRYKVACHFCHDGYPKLNAIGQRFKERGLRMEREDGFDVEKWLRSVPLTVRAHANQSFVEDGEGESTAFVKAVSAGNLGRRLSYWVDDAVLFADSDDSPEHLEPDNAWLRLELVPGGKLYVRGGRLELDLPFTQTRTPHLFSYEIYSAATGFETDGLGEHQEGFELGGDLPRDLRWSAALVGGAESGAVRELSDAAGGFDANVYLRLSQRVNRHRIGAFAYFGTNTLARRLPAAGPGSPRLLEWDNQVLRLGADANLWIRRFNLYGVFLYGRDDNSIADAARPGGTGEKLSVSGGFLQGDYHLRDEVVLTLRLNLVNRPEGTGAGPNRSFASLFPGLRVWLIDERVRVSFEYGFMNRDRPNRGQLQAELAF